MKDKMTALFVRHINRPGRYGGGGNLYLQVRARKCKAAKRLITKSWIFRYVRHGRQTWMGLGPYPDVGLAEARELATSERKKLLRGVDPLTEKRSATQAERAVVDNVLSFAECAKRYVDAQAPGWSNPKHIDQWRSTLTKLAGPVFGHLPVDQVDTALVMRCLEPLWTTRTETASRLRGRIESVLAWATVHGYRKGDNPARWRGHLDKLLPRPSQVAKVKHHPALPYQEIGHFMLQLRKDPGIASRALELTILTAARTSEVIMAEWSEIDLDLSRHYS